MNKSAFACIVALLLGQYASSVAASLADAVREDHPERYEVQRGDTLWDISSRFLHEPWLWPELWRANEEIDDPHRIYPGDVIVFRMIEGEPTLRLERRGRSGSGAASGGRGEKLAPRVRGTPLQSAIPSIDLKAIAPFLQGNRVMTAEALEDAPYVVQGEEGRILLGARDHLFARGEFAERQRAMSIVRVAGPFVDPDTGERLGLEVQEIGVGRIRSIDGPIATIAVSSAREDIRVGDRLVPTEERSLSATFFPKAPDTEVDGRIISVLDGVNQVGPYNVVALNVGTRENVEVGDVLGIHKQGQLVRDRVANDSIRMPSRLAGRLMVFRTFEKVSYGLVLSASRPLAVLDEIHEP